MRIALVSDTHMPRFGRALPRAFVEGMRAARVELILHAGDWTDLLVVPLLEAIAPVEGVAGNNDGPALHERFGTRRVVVVDGVRIGLTHGHLGAARTTPERAEQTFAGETGLAAVVFGHSHMPLIDRREDGRWLLNPGSPTDRRRQPLCSWGLLSVEAGEIVSAQIRHLPRRSV